MRDVTTGALLAIALALPALAADLPAERAPAAALLDPAPVSTWIVTVGGTVQYGPRYEGARTRGFSGAPSLSWRRVGEPEKFSAPDDAFDLALVSFGRFEAGLAGAYRGPRSANAIPELKGLRSREWALEFGGFAEYWVVADMLRARLEVKRGVRGHFGFTADLGADYVRRLGAWTFSFGPRLALGDARFMQTYYGVSAAEAAGGRAPAYSPRGGARYAGALAALAYRPNADWRFSTFVRYDRMLGQALRSPLVSDLGRRNQFTFGLGVERSFQIAW